MVDIPLVSGVHADFDNFTFPDVMQQPYTHVTSVWQSLKRHQGSTTDSLPKKWTQIVELGDFIPENINVKVENNKVYINAKYTESYGESYDLVERKRTIKIPDDVDVEIQTIMSPDGTLVLTAPFIENDTRHHILTVENEAEVVMVPSGSPNYLMHIDIGNYKPDEFSIKCNDGVLTVEGVTTKSEGGLFIRETFFRQINLPENVKKESLRCITDADGKLIIHTIKEIL